MKRSGWQLVAASSLILAVMSSAETRPQYGGTLRIAVRVAPATLDPANQAYPDSISARNLTWLMFDGLVTMDNAGRLRPALATAWQSDPGNQRWQFTLRRDVKFDDGMPLTPEVVAASLRFANPGWIVSASGDSVVIECKTATPDFLSDLALPRNAVVRRVSGATLAGTGPFHVSEWQTGRKLTLAAVEDYWGGRAFVDSIVVEFGKSSRDQVTSLELGKDDMIELSPDRPRRAGMEGRRVVSSAVELWALVFSQEPKSPEEGRLRQALSLSVDRASVRGVLLQGEGELAGGILPVWTGGYEFVFPSEFNLTRAQQLRGDVQHAPLWTIGYDANDSLARLIAERVALNARDAGLRVQPSSSGSSDLGVVRVLLPSSDPRQALMSIASSMGMGQPKLPGDSAEGLYQAENALLQTQRMIPLLHLPVSYATGPQVRGFRLDHDGRWHLPDVWLGSGAR